MGVPRLSVNVNKVATLRNARGGALPDVRQVALDCVRYGAQGITVHPRPDGRHIRDEDVRQLRAALNGEFNVEGYPTEHYLTLLESVCPTQATLVPDPPDALTSSEGWDLRRHQAFLEPIVRRLQKKSIRVSLFVEADPSMVAYAAQLKVNALELYTGPYAHSQSMPKTRQWLGKAKELIAKAHQKGIAVHAGHDLNRQNLPLLLRHLKGLAELSIGHALICDALYYGLENTIGMYRRCIERQEA